MLEKKDIEVNLPKQMICYAKEHEMFKKIKEKIQE